MAINDSFWKAEQGHLLAILRPRLEQMAVEASKQAADKAGIGFNPNLANAYAARWARDYTDNLLKQLGTTSTVGIGEIIAKWVETPGATYGQLQQSLIHYGEIRAQAIAVTETTRAYAEGEEMAYKQEGIIEWTWRTNRDELVCKICGPLNNQVRKIGNEFGKDKKGNPITKPPAHVNCRCWVAPVLAPNKERQAVFKPADLPSTIVQVAELLPIPQALGADASKNAVLQTIRYNEIASMTEDNLRAKLHSLRKTNPIPTDTIHHEKHYPEFGVTNIEDYQKILDTHLEKAGLRFFTGINETKDEIKRVWYIIDFNKKVVSVFDETTQRHYTIYPPKQFETFVDRATLRLIEVDEKLAKVYLEWTP